MDARNLMSSLRFFERIIDDQSRREPDDSPKFRRHSADEVDSADRMSQREREI
jgi:hypothetical protein